MQERVIRWVRGAGGPQQAALLAGILINLGLAAYSAFFDGCQVCRKGPSYVALAGVGFYAALVALHVFGLDAWTRRILRLGALVHVQLVGYMLLAPLPFCTVCALAAIIAVALALLSLRGDHGVLLSLARTAPVAVGAFAVLVLSRGATAAAKPVVKGPVDVVSITAYVSASCPHCIDLKSNVMPRILKDFGDRVRVTYLDGTKYDFVQSYPTLHLVRANLRQEVDYNPGYDGLQSMIQGLLAGHVRDAVVPKPKVDRPEAPVVEKSSDSVRQPVAVEKVGKPLDNIDASSPEGIEALVRLVHGSTDEDVRGWAAAQMARAYEPAFDGTLEQILSAPGQGELKKRVIHEMDHVTMDPKRAELLERVVENVSEALQLRVLAARKLAQADAQKRPQITRFADAELAHLRVAPHSVPNPIEAEIDLVLLKSIASQ